MTCAEIRDRLDDYVDGALSGTELHEVELHLAGCADCAGHERRLSALLAGAAALPREISPSRDLWPGIAERIASARPRPAAAAVRRQWTWSPALLAAAAAVLVALGATLLRVWPPAAVAPEAGTGVPQEAAWTTDPSLLAAEREYERATVQLMAALEARKASLPPATVAGVENDLLNIDAALRQVRTALSKDPGNAQLSHMLASTHQKKVDVLQRVVRLSRQI
jgi:predicted anti-sigma-YlaC factor YlaD